MIQALIFDFDGTLFDTGPGILRSVQYALERFGIRETDLGKLRKFVGPPLVDSFMELYGMPPEQAKEAVAFYRERYTPVGLLECEPYPGMPELLERADFEKPRDGTHLRLRIRQRAGRPARKEGGGHHRCTGDVWPDRRPKARGTDDRRPEV